MKAFDILTNNFGDMSNFDRLFYKFVNTYEPTYHEYEGTVPTNITTDGTPLLSWIIYGNKDNGVYCGDRTANLLNPSVLADGYHLDTTTGLPTQRGSNDRVATLTPIDVSSISAVTLSYLCTINDANFMYSIFDVNDTLLARVTSKQSGDSIDVSNAAKLYIAFYGNSAVTISSLSQVMLNSGSTPLPYEPYGYKIPIVCGGVTTPVYIGNEPLRMSNDETTFDEINNTGVVIHRVDSNGDILETPTTTSITAPEIPTTDGLQTFDVNTTVPPSSVYIRYY